MTGEAPTIRPAAFDRRTRILLEMIGTNIGTGQARRALCTAWVTVLLTACMAEAIGVASAIWPEIWMRAFSADPAVIATGVAYLKTVGRFFGFFGIGYALYCVGQGAKRM